MYTYTEIIKEDNLEKKANMFAERLIHDMVICEYISHKINIINDNEFTIHLLVITRPQTRKTTRTYTSLVKIQLNKNLKVTNSSIINKAGYVYNMLDMVNNSSTQDQTKYMKRSINSWHRQNKFNNFVDCFFTQTYLLYFTCVGFVVLLCIIILNI